MKAPFRGRFKVTSLRGYRYIFGNVEYHGGIDLVGLDDKTVYAIADGTIDAVPYEADGFGYYIRQLLPDGRRLYYGHLAQGSIVVRAGQKIKAGDKLGTMGATGRVTGAHLHLELRPKGTAKTSLDIAAYTGIPNKAGTYEVEEMTPQEAAEKIKAKCGFEQGTMDYLRKYKWADDLFLKLWKAMEGDI